MSQISKADKIIEPLILFKNWESYETINVASERGGHGGGDKRLHDKIFLNPNSDDPFKHSAGIRDGIMSLLVGVAARKSIETAKPVRIKDLTDIKPSANRA
ncbi:putative oxidoreductase YteT precursor [compost metagenome]